MESPESPQFDLINMPHASYHMPHVTCLIPHATAILAILPPRVAGEAKDQAGREAGGAGEGDREAGGTGDGERNRDGEGSGAAASSSSR